MGVRATDKSDLKWIDANGILEPQTFFKPVSNIGQRLGIDAMLNTIDLFEVTELIIGVQANTTLGISFGLMDFHQGLHGSSKSGINGAQQFTIITIGAKGQSCREIGVVRNGQHITADLRNKTGAKQA